MAAGRAEGAVDGTHGRRVRRTRNQCSRQQPHDRAGQEPPAGRRSHPQVDRRARQSARGRQEVRTPRRSAPESRLRQMDRVSHRGTLMEKHRVMLSACLLAALSAATAAAVTTDGPAPSVERQSVAGPGPEALADGKRLYDVNCANCHGARAQGAVKAGIEISIIRSRAGSSRPTSPIRPGITARPTPRFSRSSRKAFPQG